MIDPLEVGWQQAVSESNQANAANCSAILTLLCDKGIITPEEFERARAQAVAHCDQYWAQKQDEAAAEFKKQHPNLAWLADRLRHREGGPE